MSKKKNEAGIMQAYAEVMNEAITAAIPLINEGIDQVIKQSIIFESKEGMSLAEGMLSGELGLPKDGVDRVYKIAEKIAQKMEVKFTRFKVVGDSITGSLFIGILESSMKDLLSMREAIVKTGRGKEDIPWLDWLLVQGNKIIVSDYFFYFSPNKKSRSGLGIMIKNKKGRHWKVPEMYAGTIENNWLTRALTSTKTQENLLELVYNSIEASM